MASTGRPAPHDEVGLAELPADILTTILLYLEPKDFLRLCSTSRAFSSLTLDPTYWRHVARFTFRLPNQLLLQTDGVRWKTLCQRLRTQTKAYTWGKGDSGGRGGLGHDPARSMDATVSSLLRQAIAAPTEMHFPEAIDPVVDMQCGGWSTTLLTTKGDLYCAGALDGRAGMATTNMVAGRLRFEDHHPQGRERVPWTTIAQFSVGRAHVLALSDTGTIWRWRDVSSCAEQIQFTYTDVGPSSPDHALDQSHRVRKVEQGWNHGSAFVARKGIVVWESNRGRLPLAELREVEDVLVPDTHYQRPKRRARHCSVDEERLRSAVGEVVNHVLLENYCVFLTDLGKLFGWKIHQGENIDPGIFALAHFEPSAGRSRMTDVQGSFRSFAAFNTDGDVVMGSQDQLDHAWRQAFEPGAAPVTEVLPVRPPDLQDRGIISLAFGDWHQLAMTRDGHVYASGSEPQRCGCLGLGATDHKAIDFLRGVRPVISPEFALVADSTSLGRWRRIWFAAEPRAWLEYMKAGGIDPAAGLAQLQRMARHTATQLQTADWFETHGADWDLHPDLDDDDDDDAGLSRARAPAYQALRISAAGWHSGALLLVDQCKVRRMRRAHAGFLPPVNSFHPPAAATTGAGSLSPSSSSWWWWQRIASWIPAWVWNAAPAWPSFGLSGEEEDEPDDGVDPAYYHARQPWTVRRDLLPGAARHPVFFPVLAADEPAAADA